MTYANEETEILEKFFEGGSVQWRWNFKDGKLNGLYEYFYEDGDYYRTNYVNGKEHGLRA